MPLRTRLVYSVDPPLMFPGLSVRVAAFVVDFVVLLGLDIVVIAALGLPLGLLRDVDLQDLALIELVVWLGLRWLYFALWESSPYCATPGAMACHLKVVDAGDGEAPTFSQVSIRLAAKLLSVAFVGAGWLPIFFESRRRALHDLLSGCVVIRFEPRVVLDAVLSDYPEEAERLARESDAAASKGSSSVSAPAAASGRDHVAPSRSPGSSPGRGRRRSSA